MTPWSKPWFMVFAMLTLGVWIYVLNELLLSVSWWAVGSGA